MSVNIKESVVMAEDLGSKSVVGTIHKSARFMLFTTTSNAQWAADRIIKESAYPLAEVAFESNRKLFKYEPGDLFRLPYSRYGISGMICRIINIQEEDLKSGKIIVTAIEDPSYAGQTIPSDTMDIPVGYNEGPTQFPVDPLDYFEVKEAPYPLSGEDVMAIVLVAREMGYEVGYTLYMSVDGGESYSVIQDSTSFAIYGELTQAYTNDTLTIDDLVGFEVQITLGAATLETITRDNLFTNMHLSVLGNEIITWESITPLGYDNRYRIEGVYRMRYGSEQAYHPIGTPFYFIGQSQYTVVSNPQFVLGGTFQFKVVPYSSSSIGSIEYALPRTIQFVGLAREPYDPANLTANGVALNPTYSTDIDLAWNPRVRGDGAGLENPDYYTDEENVWEGLFEVRTYVNSSLVRTTTAIDNDRWTYTEAMNLSDNGSLASSVEFWLRNYLDVGGVTYYSDWVTITVTYI